MNARVNIPAIVLLLAVTVSMAVALKHVCTATDSKPTGLQPKTLASENKRALVKAAAYFELADQTGQYFPLEFTTIEYRLDVNQTYSYLILKDANCAELDLYFKEDPDKGTQRVHLMQFFLRDSNDLKHTCSNYNLDIEFQQSERFAPANPFVFKCQEGRNVAAHADIVFQDLEIELDGDKDAVANLQFSLPPKRF